jgi:hypothetical protein
VLQQSKEGKQASLSNSTIMSRFLATSLGVGSELMRFTARLRPPTHPPNYFLTGLKASLLHVHTHIEFIGDYLADPFTQAPLQKSAP